MFYSHEKDLSHGEVRSIPWRRLEWERIYMDIKLKCFVFPVRGLVWARGHWNSVIEGFTLSTECFYLSVKQMFGNVLSVNIAWKFYNNKKVSEVQKLGLKFRIEFVLI